MEVFVIIKSNYLKIKNELVTNSEYIPKSHIATNKDLEQDIYFKINAVSFKQSFFKLQTNYHQQTLKSKKLLD